MNSKIFSGCSTARKELAYNDKLHLEIVKSVNDQANLPFPKRKFLQTFLVEPSRLHLRPFLPKMVKEDRKEFPKKEIPRIYQDQGLNFSQIRSAVPNY